VYTARGYSVEFFVSCHMGAMVVQWLEHWTANPQIADLNPPHTRVCGMFHPVTVSQPYVLDVTNKLIN